MTPVIEQFNAALEEDDKIQITAICEEVIQSLYQQRNTISTREIEDMLKGLRSKRQYKLMDRICDTCIQTGLNSFRIRRQLAQVLIEEGLLTAAMAVLTDLIEDTMQSSNPGTSHENNEANGLMGRIYKQLYVITDNPSLPQSIAYLNKAVSFYQNTYEKDKSANIWHGINTVALAVRAKVDKITLSSRIDIKQTASEILQVVESLDARELANDFDYATALEASIALDDIDNAISWAEKYIQHPKTDAFELASTLRQLTEVWQLGKRFQLQRLIPLLRGALLKKEGGY
ncbi:TRAFs-binding domain-containing protein [Paraflavitalea speifideaquila]|uniref:TRAFs-binding domain-containing protein n=1 Tax=Paraflavitalea speifideaquila TaxID=3076558 RepID=UPI0028F12210|nr:TRAFs-binding domain-containing protein [Paraflavitalea speifideiaquila]